MFVVGETDEFVFILRFFCTMVAFCFCERLDCGPFREFVVEMEVFYRVGWLGEDWGLYFEERSFGICLHLNLDIQMFQSGLSLPVTTNLIHNPILFYEDQTI